MNEAQMQRYSRPMKVAVDLAAWVYLLSVGGLALFTSQPLIVTVDRLGLGALTFLSLCLACTPINIVFNFPPARRLRRMLGLYAFFMASLHVLVMLVGRSE
jgi:sulfoxide reductase heme-binding subunit YedZ